MNPCYNSGDFMKYFYGNMKALNVPAPTTLFISYQTTIATASTLVGTLHKLGKGATIAELVGATVGIEKLMVAASFGAAAYTGVVIGSVFVATGRSLACGYQISDIFDFLHRNNLQFRGWRALFLHNPEIIDVTHPFRDSYGMRAKTSPMSFEYAL